MRVRPLARLVMGRVKFRNKVTSSQGRRAHLPDSASMTHVPRHKTLALRPIRTNTILPRFVTFTLLAVPPRQRFFVDFSPIIADKPTLVARGYTIKN